MNKYFPVYAAILGVLALLLFLSPQIAKFISADTAIIGAEILKNRVKIGKIKYAMFSGRFLRKMKKEPDEVDLLVVGNIVLPELALLVREEEKRLNTEINYTVMTEEEFSFRRKKRDPFIISILAGSRVVLIGDEETMLS